MWLPPQTLTYFFVLKPDRLLLFCYSPKKVNKKTSPALWAPSPKGEGTAELKFIAAVDKKLKISYVPLNPSKLTPSSLKQGRLFNATLR